MEEPMKDKEFGDEAPESVNQEEGNNRSTWPKLAALFFFCAMIAGIAYAVYERSQAQRLADGEAKMNAALLDAQNQMAGLTAKMNALTAARQAAPAAPAPAAGPREKPPAHTSAHAQRRRADDPRWKQMQSKLDDQQKQIEAAQQNIDQTRSDLMGQLNSSHDELSGSIARSHDELVALEKRGERSFFEFNLTRSKQFQRVGPIAISLRKANTKHSFCDLNLLVDDNELNKKHVNLYEPVQFYPADYSQPLEIVIYKIDKNEARGYVSAPKYRQSELSSQAAPANAAESAQAGTGAGQTNTADLSRRPAVPQQ